MNKNYAALAVLLAVTACDAKAADTQTSTVASVSDLASLFEGEFTTLPAQAAPPAGGTVLYNLSKRVHMPALGDEVVYAEQHEKSPEGPIKWQRLYAFKFDADEKQIVMTPYTIGSNAHELAGVYKDPTPLTKLDANALKPQVGGCVVIWHRGENGFEGTIKPGTCKEAPEAGKAGAPAIVVTKTEYTENPPSEGLTTPLQFRRIR